MPCTVYKNICNKLRKKPETVQAGLTGQGGEKTNCMGYFVEQSSDCPVLLKFYLSPTTFPDTAIGGTQNNLEIRLKAGTASARHYFALCDRTVKPPNS